MGCCVETLGGAPQALPFPELFIAGAAIAIHDLVALNISGEVIPALATVATGDFQVIGVATAAALVGNAVPVVVVHGTSTPMQFSGAPAAASNGSYIFLSTAAGLATVTPPAPGVNVRLIVGVLREADGVDATPLVQLQLHSL